MYYKLVLFPQISQLSLCKAKIQFGFKLVMNGKLFSSDCIRFFVFEKLILKSLSVVWIKNTTGCFYNEMVTIINK